MTTSPALSPFQVLVVGRGRVGGSLGRWIQRAGGSVRYDTARTPPSLALLRRVRDFDLVLFTVPDEVLERVAGQFSDAAAPVALHTSGSQTAEALSRLRAAGSAVGSIHPLWAFAAPQPEPPPHLVVGIDGDPAALAMGRRLAVAFDATAVQIPPERRLLYHLCATFAAGGAAAVVATAAEIARRLELPAELGEGWRALASGAIANLSPLRLDDGLTGPSARGDVGLVTRQWQALASVAPECLPLARELTRATLDRVDAAHGKHAGRAELRALVEAAGAPPRDPKSPIS
jgi:predicted short-subunit dehydrogenase-like oxidoreductase (DUF2520 family)